MHCFFTHYIYGIENKIFTKILKKVDFFEESANGCGGEFSTKTNIVWEGPLFSNKDQHSL